MENKHNNTDNNSKVSKKVYNSVLEQQAILLDNIETQIWYLTNEITYGAVNQSYASYIGLEKKDLEGKNIFEVRGREEAELCVAGNSKVFKEKKQIRTEEWVTSGNGKRRLFCITKTPKIDDKGNVEYVVCTADDITERKRAEERLKERSKRFEILNRITIASNQADDFSNFLENVLESTLELMNYEGGGLYLVDEKTRIASVVCQKNIPQEFFEAVRFRRIDESPYDELFIKGNPVIIENYQDFNPALSKKWNFLSLASIPLYNKDNIIGALNIISKSRYTFTGEEREIFLYIGREIGTVIARMQAEEALKESEKNYRRSYNRAEFYKDLFAHDMNNILQNLKSSAELLRLWLNDPEKGEKVKDLITIVKEQIDRGASLIANVRKLSAIEDEGVDEYITELVNILTKTIKHVKNRFIERQIEIEFNPPLTPCKVKAGELLVDVFENILINAIMHNKSDVIQVEVKLSEIQEDDFKFFKIEFLDNGIGIIDDVKEIVFNRINKKEKGTSGMGIGLSLVNKIITSYGGKIWIENRVKGDYTKGSNFIIMLKKD